jgi:para-aminobenzoate synthetase / 4-amino-4-deoxychorismate lyase
MPHWFPLPAGVSALAEGAPGTVLLETAKPDAEPPLSRLFLAPYKTFCVYTAGELAALFAAIDEALGRGHFAAGFFAYECGAAFEPAASSVPAPGEPLAWFGLYELCYAFDHRIGRFIDDEPPGLAEASVPEGHGHVETGPAPEAERFAAAIGAIHAWIRAGDIYQLNYTWPLALHTPAQPATLYAELAARQPVPYAAFVHWQPGRHILSLSPELFFRIESADGQRRIVTRPMKGTAARGRTTAEDTAAAEALRASAKNCAENVMIVDLLRNDLGRLCVFGSVQVDELFAVERHPTLWQMTSTVSGMLRADVRTEDLLRALFPSGSVTGAPKVRAMQLIAQLEVRPRGVYTGAIGYFSGERTVFNVAIRTLELEDGRGSMGVGSGIVIDSTADDELSECLLKTAFLTRANANDAEKQEPFRLIETLLWRDGFALLELHLDRLADSADYFDFACEREAVRTALLDAASALPAGREHRVRLLMDASGALELSNQPLTAPTGEPVRVTLAHERTDPNNRFLFHKTTRRALYAQAFAEASAAGFADVLFFNTRDELTEGAISNVFLELDGRMVTPPVSCGLLAGVYRRHMLALNPQIEERVLTHDDLRRASAVWIANAVRGLRRAILQVI